MSHQVLNCGYVPLVDCAPLIIAKELGFAAEEGLDLNLVRQPSWSALRDMLALGHLDAAQMLSPMPVAMSLGMGGLGAQIDCLMVLSVNGTVFGASNALAAALGPLPFGDASAVLEALGKRGPLRIGVPFPYSMHRLLLSYWTATHPAVNAEIVTVPPTRMADAVSQGHVDAFWVGEPWGSAIVQRGVGQILMTGRDVWAFAPEKVLAARHDWAEQNPQTTRKLMRAIYHAAKWLDADSNKPLAIEILGRSEHLNLAHEVIDPAMTGHLTPAPGAPPVQVSNFLVFHAHTALFPWRSQAAWIAAQLGASDAEVKTAMRCFRSDLYRENLGPLGAELPRASQKTEGAQHEAVEIDSGGGGVILARDAFFDGRTFDFTQNPDE